MSKLYKLIQNLYIVYIHINTKGDVFSTRQLKFSTQCKTHKFDLFTYHLKPLIKHRFYNENKFVQFVLFQFFLNGDFMLQPKCLSVSSFEWQNSGRTIFRSTVLINIYNLDLKRRTRLKPLVEKTKKINIFNGLCAYWKNSLALHEYNILWFVTDTLILWFINKNKYNKTRKYQCF